MTISIIAAMSDNGVIGQENELPWHLPEDLKHFKKMTMGKPIVMGRKTFESIGKKPLKGRQNIVLTSNRQFTAEGAYVAHSMEQALETAGDAEEVVIAGGATVYKAALPATDKMYLTFIHEKFEGDTRFPDINPAVWEEIEREDYKQNGHPYAFSFVIYRRKSNYRKDG